MKAIRIISYTLPPHKPSFVVLVELKHPLYRTALIKISNKVTLPNKVKHKCDTHR